MLDDILGHNFLFAIYNVDLLEVLSTKQDK